MNKGYVILIWAFIVLESCTSHNESCTRWYASLSEEVYADLNWIDLDNVNHIQDIFDFNDTSENWKKNVVYIEVDGNRLPLESRRLRDHKEMFDYFGYGILVEENKDFSIDSLVSAIRYGQDLQNKEVFENVYFILCIEDKIDREATLKRVKNIVKAMCISFDDKKVGNRKFWPIVISDCSTPLSIPPPPVIDDGKITPK